MPAAGAPTATMAERASLGAAAVYLALIPIGTMTAIRSIAFVSAALLALNLLWQARRGRGRAIPPPGSVLVAVLVSMTVWSIGSVAWSVRPAYTLQELRAELMWNMLTALIFYVVAGIPRAWSVLTTTAVAGFAVSALMALASPLLDWRFARTWNVDSGYFSTYIVMISAILLTVPDRAPRRPSMAATVATIVVLVLALAAARRTENRMVFIALATVFATATALVALRSRGASARAPLRWALALAALAVALGALFVDAAHQKALKDYPPQTSIAQTFAADPRLPLWQVTMTMIGERPWAGYGFGRAIVAPELRSALRGDLFAHPHNVIASQWLQTGVVGAGLLVLLLAALIGRYVRFYRSSDDRLAFVGVVGIALVAGFVLKNLTDDFLYRSGAREFFALNALLVGWGTRRQMGSEPRYSLGASCGSGSDPKFKNKTGG